VNKPAGDSTASPSSDDKKQTPAAEKDDKKQKPTSDKQGDKSSKPDQTKSPSPAGKKGNQENSKFAPSRTRKPQTKNVEKKGNNLPSGSDPKKSPAGNTGLGDKAKAATDPKKFAADQAKKAVTKAATKAATGAATKALGSTIGTAIGGPLGTAAGFVAGMLIDVGIEVGEKMLKYVMAVIGVIVIFFVVLFFLILLAIASFFFSGGGGYSSHQESDVANQITPINSPVGNPPEVKTLQNANTWYTKQETGGDCHCTAVTMYLTFLGFDVTREKICNLTGEYVDLAPVEDKYKVNNTGQITDTNSFKEYQTFIKDAINKGKPVIIGVGYPISSKTIKTHFLVVTGYDSKNIYVNDPNSTNPKSQTWETLETAKISQATPGEDYHGYTISLNK
jgi:hypothetical protein